MKLKEIPYALKRAFKHRIYGKVYYPLYTHYYPISSEEHEIYNKEGRKLESYFLRDIHWAPGPTNVGKYMFMDRYNFALKKHFYSGKCMTETMGTPTHKYGFLPEAYNIAPHDYEIFKTHKGIEKDFDFIFTNNEELLQKLPNARMFNFMSTMCYQKVGEQIDIRWHNENKHNEKTKDISMVCSGRCLTKCHEIRNYIAKQVKDEGKVDGFGAFFDNPILFKSESLDKYRFQIVVENERLPNAFTEKILDCFISMTIPVYYGCINIDKFFNPDGIIFIADKDVDNIGEILKNLNEKEYLARLEAVKENYYKSIKYTCHPFDRMYEEFFLEQ